MFGYMSKHQNDNENKMDVSMDGTPIKKSMVVKFTSVPACMSYQNVVRKLNSDGFMINNRMLGNIEVTDYKNVSFGNEVFDFSCTIDFKEVDGYEHIVSALLCGFLYKFEYKHVDDDYEETIYYYYMSIEGENSVTDFRWIREIESYMNRSEDKQYKCDILQTELAKLKEDYAELEKKYEEKNGELILLKDKYKELKRNYESGCEYCASGMCCSEKDDEIQKLKERVQQLEFENDICINEVLPTMKKFD